MYAYMDKCMDKSMSECGFGWLKKMYTCTDGCPHECMKVLINVCILL